jgi:hypothetical protein
MSARPNVATMNSKANVSIDPRAVKISAFSSAHLGRRENRRKHSSRICSSFSHGLSCGWLSDGKFRRGIGVLCLAGR